MRRRRRPALGDAELYVRGVDTLVAAWEADAAAASGASVRRLSGAVVAVFPNEPESAFYNNALLAGDLTATERTDALDGMETTYAAAGIERFAAWVHESDGAMRSHLERRGYTIDTWTRAMGMVLDDVRLPRPAVELGPPEWSEHLRVADIPPNLLRHIAPDTYRILVARLDGESVATAIAFDHRGDCGVYNVGTLEHARRRGLATALTALHLHDARTRGCDTASLQSTPMAQRVYAAVGFRDLGRILEYTPNAS